MDKQVKKKQNDDDEEISIQLFDWVWITISVQLFGYLSNPIIRILYSLPKFRLL